MKTRLHLLRLALCLGLMSAGISTTSSAQTAPVPPPPPTIRKDKEAEAAAAIQAPALPPALARPPSNPASLPDLPRPTRVLPQPPPAPLLSRPSVAAPPTLPPTVDATASKMKALDAATKDDGAVVAPRIATPAEKMPVTTSTSSSGQFRVHGKELTTRSAMSSHLDAIAAEMRAVLNDSQPFGQPIMVQLNTGEDAANQPPGTPPISVVITEITSGGFHLQLTITESAGLKLSDLRRETVRMLLAERIVRGQSKLTKPDERLMLPDWLFTGVMQAMDYRAAARPTTMFAAIFKSGKIYGIEEIIEVSPVEMDSLSRAIYETSCAALVMALVEQPSGGQHFNQFLSSLATDPRSERELLDAAFPKFAATASSLNKWWALQMATLSKRGMAEPLDADASLKALEEATTIRYHSLVAEVTKDIKQRPFVIPPPLNVIPPPQPKPEPKAVSSSPKPVGASSKPSASTKTVAESKEEEKPAEEVAEETAEEAESGKKSRWLRYLTFGLVGRDKKPDEPDETESDAPAAEKVVEEPTVVDMPPETVPEDESEKSSGGGLFSRLLSRDRLRASEERQQAAGEMERKAEEEVATKPDVDEKAIAEKAAADKKGAEKMAAEERAKAESEKPKTVAADKPKDEKAEEKPEEVEKESKPSKFNPLNWFRGKKKTEDGDAPPPEEKKSDDSAKPKADASEPTEKPEAEVTVLFDGAHESNDPSLLKWYSPSLADALNWLSPPTPQYTFLDFLKRKKKKEEEPEVAPEPAPEKEPEEDKPKSTPPKSTNPNAKPAARPVKPADGSRRTTNPSAKPVPMPQKPLAPPEADKDDWLGKPPPGMVEVSMPLEDYRHILKHPDREKILQHNEASLRALQLRSSVLFRPVVTGYLAVVLSLKEGKTKNVDQSLEALRKAALEALQNTKAVRDYLDWYEANETGRLSGKFDDYLNLPAIIQRELPPREDPISRYLDAVDRQFSK